MKNTKSYFLIIIGMLFTISMLNASNMEVSGTISTNTTWTGVDTVKVIGDVTINDNKTLTIDPGIYVEFQGHFSLTVHGRLLAEGTEADRITFTAANHSTGWNRIIFDVGSVSYGQSRISYCNLEYGKANTGSFGNVGGAIFADETDSGLLISNCLFNNNYAVWDGGAINIDGTAYNVQIENCEFLDNDSGNAAVIDIRDNSTVLQNCLICDNSCIGVCISSCSPTLINNTIVNNNGYGIKFSSDSDPTIKNTLIYGNSSAEIYIVHSNCDPNFYYCNIEGGLSGFSGSGSGGNFSGDYQDNIDADPQFIGSGDHPYDIISSSPCINAGDPTTTEADIGAYDLAGNPRFYNGIVDIGAYEEPVTPDQFPGNCLTFDGTDDYITGTGIRDDLTAFTLETWVYHNSLPEEVQRYITIGPEVAVLRYDGSIYGGVDQLHFYIKKTNGSLYGIEVNNVLTTGEWMHIAGTYDGTDMKLYLNGELLQTASPAGGLYPPSGDFVFSKSGAVLDGKMDEVRLWDEVRSQAEIRESMNRTLSGDDVNLRYYWQFNEGTGSTTDIVGGGLEATLNNMAEDDWIDSGVPTGAGNSDSQTETNGIVVFSGVGLEMDFASHNSASVTATKIDLAPNQIPTDVTEVYDDQYWVVNRFGTGTFEADLTFSINEYIDPAEEDYLYSFKLYHRESSSEADWTFITNSFNVVSGSNAEISFSGISEDGQYLICQNIPETDSNAGYTIEFDGSNDYVNCGNDDSFDVGNTLTIEAWIKPSDLSYRQSVFSTRKNNESGCFQFEVGIGSGGTNRVAVTGPGTWVVQTEDNVITENEWNHIVYTRNGTGAGNHKIYVNGAEQTLIDYEDFTFINNSSDKLIGSKNGSNEFFTGLIEEMRLWNVARDSIQIRENMHIPLSGTEAGLVSYWQFNEGSGLETRDEFSYHHGTLMNTPAWTASTIPFGPGTVNTQTEVTGVVDFPGTGLSMNFASQTGAEITVTKIDTLANINPTEPETVYDSQYWVVERYGSGSFNTNLTFSISEDFTVGDEIAPENVKLYTRESNDDSDWTYLADASAIDAAADKVTFNGITDFSQFIIGKNSAFIVVEPDTLDFGDVVVNNSSVLQFTIENTDSGVLAGEITTPPGYEVEEASRSSILANGEKTKDHRSLNRNTISYTVSPYGIATFDVTFQPTSETTYNDQITITHNAEGDDEIIVVSGTGIIPYITVSSPNGGEEWEPGSTHSITWNSAYTGDNVKIEIYESGNFYDTIISSTDDNGSYSWTISETYDTGTQYTVKIEDVSDPLTYDYSDGNFTLLTADITYNPASFEKNLLPGASSTENLTIGNLGNIDLDYTASVSYIDRSSATHKYSDRRGLNFPENSNKLVEKSNFNNSQKELKKHNRNIISKINNDTAINNFLPNNTAYSRGYATIGAGADVSDNEDDTDITPFGTIYEDGQNQILFTASELSSAGLPVGDITRIGWNVADAASQTMNGFNIEIKHTTETYVNGWETGFTNVFSGSHTAFNGWNDFTFSTPFTWDGTSNILVKVCFDNSSWSVNSTVYFDFAWEMNGYVYHNGTSGCSDDYEGVANERPQTRFEYLSGPPTLFVLPESNNFGDQNNGFCSEWQTFTLHNGGIGSISVSSITLTGTNADQFEIQNNPAPCSLPPDATIDVRFCPTTLGEKSAYLTINDDRETTNVALSGTSISPAYCTTNYTDTYYDWISNVAVNTIDNASGSVGYEDYTAISTDLMQGISYDIYVDIQVQGYYRQHCCVWIDWNQDYDFEDDGEAYDLGDNDAANGYYQFTEIISVPQDAALGNTRMRVAERYGTAPYPCGNYAYVEAEDYTINVISNDPAINWLKLNGVNQVSGTVLPASRDEDIIEVGFNATELEVGVYEAIIVIESNDPDEATVNIPVTLNVSGQLDPPQNVTIEIYEGEGFEMYLSWDEVAGANSYKIYSDTDPYGTFETEEWSGIDITWDSNINGIEKKFYRVVASTDSVTRDSDLEKKIVAPSSRWEKKVKDHRDGGDTESLSEVSRKEIRESKIRKVGRK